MAQRKEGMVVSRADQTLMKIFVSACINMKYMSNTPENPKEYDIYPKGLKAQLDAIYVQEFKVVITLNQIIDPASALKLANELRA